MKLDNVVGAKRYSFEDRDSKRLVEGVNVFFMVQAKTGDEVGVLPSKISLPITTWNEVNKLPFPCNCELLTEDTFTSKGIKTKAVGLLLAKG